jgi:hypothetical protein
MSDAFERNILQLHAFYAKHGEPKHGGVRENEASLAIWMGNQRKNKKKGLNPELCARVEREFPWWRWTVWQRRHTSLASETGSVDILSEEPDVSTSKTEIKNYLFQYSF